MRGNRAVLDDAPRARRFDLYSYLSNLKPGNDTRYLWRSLHPSPAASLLSGGFFGSPRTRSANAPGKGNARGRARGKSRSEPRARARAPARSPLRTLARSPEADADIRSGGESDGCQLAGGPRRCRTRSGSRNPAVSENARDSRKAEEEGWLRRVARPTSR
jgi:hypothetical protein